MTYNLIPEFRSNTVEATIEYKPNKNLKIAIAPQYGESIINFRNAGGHTRDWGNILNVQSRVNYKGFFASLNYFHAFSWDGKNGNGDLGTTSNGNRSTAYITTGTDNRGDIQVYDLATQLPFSLGENWRFVTGIDVKLLRFKGDGVFNQDSNELASRHGRFEDDDNFDVIGGYLQATFKPSEKVKINAVARVDNFSIYGSSFSPRLGLVYNPDENKNKALRASVSRAYRSQAPIITNFDFALAGNNLIGGRVAQTFNNTLIDYDGVTLARTTTTPSLQSILATIDPSLAASVSIVGNATSTLTDPLTGAVFNQVSDMSIPKASLEYTDGFEIGYTGISNNLKFKYTIDAFYQVQSNMAENFTDIGPIVSFNNIGDELATALVAAGIDQAAIDGVVLASANVYGNTNFNALSDQAQEGGVTTATPVP